MIAPEWPPFKEENNNRALARTAAGGSVRVDETVSRVFGICQNKSIFTFNTPASYR